MTTANRYQIQSRKTFDSVLRSDRQEVTVYDVILRETGEVLGTRPDHAAAERLVIRFMADDARTAREYGSEG
jgi:hypothetical protein